MYFSYAYNIDQPLNRMSAAEDEEEQCEEFNCNNNNNYNNNGGRNYNKQANINSEFGKAKEPNFNWAHELQRELVRFNSTWRVALIQGYVGKL